MHQDVLVPFEPGTRAIARGLHFGIKARETAIGLACLPAERAYRR